MVGNEHKLGVGDVRTQVERRILRGEPFRDFGVRKEEYILDSFFVNGIERQVQRRDDGVIGQRQPHDLEAVFVEDRRLAGVVAQVVDGNLFCHSADGLDRLRVRAATQVEGSVEIEYDCFDRAMLLHVSEYSNSRTMLKRTGVQRPFFIDLYL